MEKNLEPSWKNRLKEEFSKEYYLDLKAFVEEAYQKEDSSVFPPQEHLFQAFNVCPFDQLKVVILGQDPYPTKGHANGLCFSVNQDVRPLAKSLQNIFREVKEDLEVPIPEHGDLTRWAAQGVLLLNDVLTVQEGMAGSHQKKGWEHFTKRVIEEINDQKEHVVFLLWGNYAQKKAKWIDEEKHLVLRSGHPSPLSANQGKWFGNKHFSKTNAYLTGKGLEGINW